MSILFKSCLTFLLLLIYLQGFRNAFLLQFSVVIYLNWILKIVPQNLWLKPKPALGTLHLSTDGRSWGIVSGILYQIDTSNTSISSVGQTGLGAVSLVGLNDSVLLFE